MRKYRRVRDSTGSERPNWVLPLTMGGSNFLPPHTLSPSRVLNLLCVRYGLIATASLPKVLAPLDEYKHIPLQYFNTITVDGPVVMKQGATYTYKVTNYDSRTAYSTPVFTVDNSTIYTGNNIQTDGSFTLTAPPAVAPGPAFIILNNYTFPVTVVAAQPATPVITAPIDGATDRPAAFSIMATTFDPAGASITHQSTDWQLATDSAFNNVVQQISATTSLISWDISGLSTATTYYARVRYTASNNMVSGWSTPISFTTRAFWGASVPQGVVAGADIAASDYFGFSVSLNIDGTLAVVGAPGKTSSKGAVYIFQRSGTTWTQVQKLQPAELANNDNFGISTDISDDSNYIVVGCFGRNNYHGGFYIFFRASTTWEQQAYVSPPFANSGRFGLAVSIDSTGTRIVVGDFAYSSRAGAAHVYLRTGTNWAKEYTFQASNPVADDCYGIDVDISGPGTTIFVGACQDNYGDGSYNGTLKKGYVASYIFNGATWESGPVLTASDGQPGDGFGRSVRTAIGAARMVVGAPWANGGTGKAYYFFQSASHPTTGTPSAWTQNVIYAPTDITESDKVPTSHCKAAPIPTSPSAKGLFGFTTAIASGGTYVFIGRPLVNGNGKGFIYSRTDDFTFPLSKTVEDPANTAVSGFCLGLGISRDGNYLFAGAYAENTYSGKAYIFA